MIWLYWAVQWKWQWAVLNKLKLIYHVKVIITFLQWHRAIHICTYIVHYNDLAVLAKLYSSKQWIGHDLVVLNCPVQWIRHDLAILYWTVLYNELVLTWMYHIYWTIKRTGCIGLLCCTVTWLYCTSVLYYDLAVLGVAVVVEDDRRRRRVIVQLNTINQVINNLRQPRQNYVPSILCSLFVCIIYLHHFATSTHFRHRKRLRALFVSSCVNCTRTCI